MSRKRRTENNELPKGFYRKRDKRSSSGYAYQMKNPFYGIKDIYKPTKKILSLRSDFDTAIFMHRQVLEMYSKWEKNSKGKAHFHQKSTTPSHIKTPYTAQVKCASNVLVKNIVQLLLDDNKSRLKQAKPKGISSSTEKNYRASLNKIHKWWGRTSASMLSTQNIQIHLREEEGKQHYRSAKELRSSYKRLLEFAIQNGMVSFDRNPVEHTEKVTVLVKRSRLSTSVYNEVLAELNDQPIIARATVLAAISLMRCSDLCLIRKEKGKDWDQRLKRYMEDEKYAIEVGSNFILKMKFAPYSYVDMENKELVIFQHKSGIITKLSLSHHISDKMPTLGEIVDELLISSNHESAFLISDQNESSGEPIKPDKLSKLFTKAIKNFDHTWLNKKAPTFAELRPYGRQVMEEYQKDLRRTDSISRAKSIRKVSSTIVELVQNSVIAYDTITTMGHSSENTEYIYKQQRDLGYQMACGYS